MSVTNRKLWFTSDTHFQHKRIIELQEYRKFNSIEEHDVHLTDMWNSRVKPDDIIIHAGDFALGKTANWPDIVAKLHGEKHLVLGNHDGTRTKMLAAGFDKVYTNLLVYDGTTRYWVAHVPLSGEREGDHRALERPVFKDAEVLNLADPGSTFDTSSYDILVHGHVHSAWRFKDHQVNVGVDVWGLKPISARELVDTWKVEFP